MAVQQPKRAVLWLFGIFLTLKFTLSVCLVFWCQAHSARVRGEEQTGGRFIEMRQRKASCWYSGGNWVINFALRIDVLEPHLFLTQRHITANIVVL